MHDIFISDINNKMMVYEKVFVFCGDSRNFAVFMRLVE